MITCLLVCLSICLSIWMCLSVGFVHVTRFCFSHFLRLLSPIYQSATVCLSACLPVCLQHCPSANTHTLQTHMDIQNHVRLNTQTKVKNRRRGNADAAAGNRGEQGGCARSPTKFSDHLGGHAAEHDKSTEGEREMPRPSRGSGPRAKSGIPQPRQIFLRSLPACLGTTTSDCNHKTEQRQQRGRQRGWISAMSYL